MATYNLADLIFQNGKLYSGSTPLTARDNIGIYKPTSDAAPSIMGNDAAGINYQLPLWAALNRWDSFLPSAPSSQEGDMSWLTGSSDPYAGIRSNLGLINQAYSGQVDPFLEFTNTGDNRDALYGAYMWGQNNGGRDTTEMTSAITPQSSFDYSSGAFDNRVQLPDLLKNYTGETYSNTGAFKSPYASQAAEEAQQLLKKFYPGATQEQLDRAAYAALQSGVRYSSDLGTQFNDNSNWYYGGGPLPTVKAIAGQLGGVTPQLQTFLDQNWKTYADKYAGLREQAQAAQDAEDAGMVKSGLGALGVFGGLAGLGAAGGLEGILGNSGGSMFDGIGDWFSNLFSGNTQFAPQDIVDLFNNAGTQGYDQLGNLLSQEDQIFNLFQNAGMPGYDQYGSQIAQQVSNYLTQNPGSTIQNALKALSGSGGTGSLLGTIAGGLLGAYNGSQKAGDITTSEAPWGPQQPYLTSGWSKAQNLLNNGSPLQTQANTNYQNILNGSLKNPYLGQDNPYLQKQIDYANEDVTRAMMPAMNQANRASGSFGNSGVADQFGKSLTDAYSRNANTMRFQDYTQQQNLAESDLNRRAQFTQGANNFAWQPLQNYSNIVGGAKWGGTSSQPYFNNPASSILGGALAGNKIGSLWG